MDYSIKTQWGRGEGGSWGHTFLKFLLEFSIFLLYPRKFQVKQSSTPGNSTKLCQIPGKLQGRKSRSLECPHYSFFFIGNSTLFLINPWKLHMLFLWYPWKFHVLNTPPSPTYFVFFWNNPITKKKTLQNFQNHEAYFKKIVQSQRQEFIPAIFMSSR